MKEDVRMLGRWDSLTDLDDCVALVTGARIKIGYHNNSFSSLLFSSLLFFSLLFFSFSFHCFFFIMTRYQTALRLLRSGVTVIGVTRFPNDAARRYSLEEDYSIWKHKLRI